MVKINPVERRTTGGWVREENDILLPVVILA